MPFDYKTITPAEHGDISSDDLIFGADVSQSNGTPKPFHVNSLADWVVQNGSTFNDSDNGAVPASGGGTDNFLRADGTWDSPTENAFVDQINIIYVSKNGNDTNSGLKPFLPKLTIAAGITAAAALISGPVTAAAVVVLDKGDYTENLTLSDNVSLYAPNATIIGAIVAGVGSGCTVDEHYAASGSTTLFSIATNSGKASLYKANIADGRGTGGALTNVNLFQNDSSGRVLFVEIGKQAWVPQGGIGFRDSSGAGFGHIHLKCPDIYLAGNNAQAIRTNNANTNVIGSIDHILETGTPTGTVGIDMRDASSVVKLTVSEIIADEVWNISAGELYLQCPKLTGTRTGTPKVLGGWDPSAADRLLYGSAAGATSETAFTAYGRTLVGLADATALAGQVDSFFLTPSEGNAAYQPLDSDLTSIAALVTTTYGRSLLTLANTAALTAEIDDFTSVLSGGVPASGGGTTHFLRADGTWVAPPSSGWSPSGADKLLYGTGAGTTAETDFTDYGRTLVSQVNASDTRTTLGLEYGATAQATSIANPFHQQNLTGYRNSTTQYTVSADWISCYYDWWNWSYGIIGPRTRTCDISVAGPIRDGRDQAAAFSADTWIYLYWIVSWDDINFYTIASLNPPSYHGGPNLPTNTAPWCFIGAFRLNASGQFYATTLRGNRIYYQDGITDATVLSGGTASTATSVSVASYVPSNALDYEINWTTENTVGTVRYSSISNVSGGVASWRQQVSAGQWQSSNALIPNSSQTFYYFQSASSALSSSINISSYSVPNGAI